MMKKITAKRGIMVAVALYFISYFVLTLNGYYAATARGLVGLPDGTYTMAPKYGYNWFLPSDFDFAMRGDFSPVGILYLPLIYLDRKFWHTREKAESMEYPVRGYFDFETREFRDIH